MKNKAFLKFMVITAVLFAFSVGSFALSSTNKPNEVMEYIVGKIDTLPEYADVNGDKEVNILDVIKMMKKSNNDTGIEIIGQDGRKITDGDVIEMRKETTYQLTALLLTDNTKDNITWSSSNNAVAYVYENGQVDAISKGAAVITAALDNVCALSFNVVVYEVEETPITKRWNFNEGFTVDNPLTFDSEHDWSIEWRSRVPSGADITFMGQSQTENDSSTTKGNIYLKWNDSNNCSLVFQPQEGEGITLDYTFYSFLNENMNVWKLTYSAKDNQLILEVSTDEENDSEVNWSPVAIISAYDFSLTVTNLVDIQNSEDEISVEYIAVDCMSYTRME